MPLYTYKCECGEEYDEFFTTMKEAEELESGLKCPKCGSLLKERLMGMPRTIFKGSGWTQRTDRNYDTTSSIKEHTEEVKKQRDSWTSKDLYGE